jgi:hypothetical protein
MYVFLNIPNPEDINLLVITLEKEEEENTK